MKAECERPTHRQEAHGRAKIGFFITAFLALLLAGCATPPGVATGGGNVADDKVVYHFNDAANATATLRNSGNHLEVNPQARIVVVTHAQDVDF